MCPLPELTECCAACLSLVLAWPTRNRLPHPWSTWRACSGGCWLPASSTRLLVWWPCPPPLRWWVDPWESDAPACTHLFPTPLGGKPYPTMRSWPRGHHGVIPCRHWMLISMKILSFYISAGLQNFISCILTRANSFSDDLESLHIILSHSYEEIFYLTSFWASNWVAILCVFVCSWRRGFLKSEDFLQNLFPTGACKGLRRTKTFSFLYFLMGILCTLFVREVMRSKEYNTVPLLRQLMVSKDLE